MHIAFCCFHLSYLTVFGEYERIINFYSVYYLLSNTIQIIVYVHCALQTISYPIPGGQESAENGIEGKDIERQGKRRKLKEVLRITEREKRCAYMSSKLQGKLRNI